MSKPIYWTTQQGEKIEVKWMTSQHLVHTFNMLLRKNDLDKTEVSRLLSTGSDKVFEALYGEIKDRRLLAWSGKTSMDYAQLAIPKLRETPTQLAMLRAILDTRDTRTLIDVFYLDPDSTVNRLASDDDRPELRAKFVEYRLMR